MDFKVTCVAALAAFAVSTVYAQVKLGDAGGWLESAYAQWADDGSDSYNVYYSGEGNSGVKVDASLVRKYGSTWRVDVPGLKAGSYTLKIVGVKGGKEGPAAAGPYLCTLHCAMRRSAGMAPEGADIGYQL